MTYTSSSRIQSLDDVRQFFHHLRHERRLDFDPHEMFESYVTCEGGALSLSECPLYNRLMDEAIEVCRREGMKIEEI